MAYYYINIQNDLIKRFKITIDENSKCYGRTHAHIRERKVCKWFQKNSFPATFELAHEIGHIMTNNSKMRRCEEEYSASKWAIETLMNDYGLEIAEKTLKDYQEYINDEYDRGIRRGGSLPDISSFNLYKVVKGQTGEGN